MKYESLEQQNNRIYSDYITEYDENDLIYKLRSPNRKKARTGIERSRSNLVKNLSE